MRELVVGDIHFGVKSNSLEWLYKQCKLIDNQITEIVNTKNIQRIVFLGDVFDIRYSINQQVAGEVKNSIRKLVELCLSKNIYIVFIAGNHDYYSPLEEASKYNAYETVFGSEFLKIHKNVYFVTEEPLLKDDSLFLPWYWTENTEHFDDILYRYKMKEDVKAIYCHADLGVWPGSRIASLRGIPVYAGHIHYINEDTVCNLHNIGACCALTFADTNEDRFLYILDNFNIVEKITNVSTPKFIRLYNEEIFNDREDNFYNCFVQLCISRKNIELATYIDRIKEIKSKYIDANIRIHLIEDENNGIENEISGEFSPNVAEYIMKNIPSNLIDKYNIIKSKF